MTVITTGQMKLVRQVAADLDRHEGFREWAYPDPLSPLFEAHPNERWGYVHAREILSRIGVSYQDAVEKGAPWTYGYGETKGVTPDHKIDKLRATRKLEDRVIEIDNALKDVFTWYASASFVTRTIMINMVYNMGMRGFLKFRNTIRYIKEGNHKQAAANMRHSRWFRQTKSRAVELSDRMETQKIPEEYLAGC